MVRNFIQIVQSADYGRTQRNLMQNQFWPLAPRAVQFVVPEYGCMPIERLSIRRMRVLGAFPVLAVLDDLKISNFRGGACPRLPYLLVCSCFTVQFPQKKGNKQCEQRMWE